MHSMQTTPGDWDRDPLQDEQSTYQVSLLAALATTTLRALHTRGARAASIWLLLLSIIEAILDNYEVFQAGRAERFYHVDTKRRTGF